MMRLLDLMHDERGSISPAVPAFFLALMLIVGLVVDGGAKASAVVHAQTSCQQAIRAAGQSVTIINGTPTLNRSTAYTTANAILAAAGVDGTLTIDGTILTCEATDTVSTTFLGVIGINTLTAHASTTANLTTGVQEANR